MMTILGRSLVVLVGLTATGAVIARTVFERQIMDEIDALLASARRAAQRPLSEADLEVLAEPVQRWLRYSQVVGKERPTTVRLRQEGDFQMDGRGWLPFKADQYFTTDPPGLLWKATFRMAPLVWVVGRDQYRDGEGSIQMRVLSLVPVAHKTGGGLNQGDLLRYLGELQWFPAGALADYVSWEAAGNDRAVATMSYGGISASMTFLFDADGRLVEERATRYNDARGKNEAWTNRNDADREFGGIRVPAAGEARWEYDSSVLPYIRWRVTDVEQNQPARY
jgi:hypothetical protein